MRALAASADAIVSQGSRLEVDLGAVAANVRTFVARTAASVMAVVKADGFGHGAADVARTALAHGAGSLGVTSRFAAGGSTLICSCLSRFLTHQFGSCEEFARGSRNWAFTRAAA